MAQVRCLSISSIPNIPDCSLPASWVETSSASRSATPPGRTPLTSANISTIVLDAPTTPPITLKMGPSNHASATTKTSRVSIPTLPAPYRRTLSHLKVSVPSHLCHTPLASLLPPAALPSLALSSSLPSLLGRLLRLVLLRRLELAQ